MKRIFLLLIIPVLLAAVLACSTSAQKPDTGAVPDMTVGFYNVENLFDTENDPDTDDDEFTPTGRNQWSEANYQQKLKNLAKVISQLGDEDGPELLGLAEIENRKVLEDLVAQEALKKHGYKIVHEDSPDHRGIDVALLYKEAWFDPADIATYTVDMNDPEHPDRTTREVLSVTGATKKGEDLTVIVNHWPSRRGGADQTAFKRAAAAQVAKSVVRARMAEDPNAKIMIMGDFNDGPADASMVNVLGAGRNLKEAELSGLFNPMFAMKDTADVGTYRYKGEIWNLFDQVVLSEGLWQEGKGWRYRAGSATIYNPDFMCEKSGKYKDAPLKAVIGGKFREEGQSDHFPVYVQLKYN